MLPLPALRLLLVRPLPVRPLWVRPLVVLPSTGTTFTPSSGSRGNQFITENNNQYETAITVYMRDRCVVL